MKQTDFEALFNAAKRGDKQTAERLSAQAAYGLSAENKDKLERALNDPEFLKSVLDSDKARQIMKKLQGGEN